MQVLLWWQQLDPKAQLVITIIISYLLLLTLAWFIIKFFWRKPIAPLWLYLSYSSVALLFWPFVEMARHSGWRRKWLIRSDLKEGQTFLEEGFGMGSSPIMAARIVGRKGVVYALDNEPLHVAILWFRAKVRGVRNIKLILSDAKVTGLADESVDVVFICDAFHEFPDKQGTLKELYRILRPGGTLSMWEESEGKMKKLLPVIQSSGLFSVLEHDKKFCRFVKTIPT